MRCSRCWRGEVVGDWFVSGTGVVVGGSMRVGRGRVCGVCG